MTSRITRSKDPNAAITVEPIVEEKVKITNFLLMYALIDLRLSQLLEDDKENRESSISSSSSDSDSSSNGKKKKKKRKRTQEYEEEKGAYNCS